MECILYSYTVSPYMMLYRPVPGGFSGWIAMPELLHAASLVMAEGAKDSMTHMLSGAIP